MTEILPASSAAALDAIRLALHDLRREMKERYDRHVSLADLLFDRWETARFYGFGEGTSCYNNVLILGAVKVGRSCWIGPNTVLDGSGGLEIGDHCSISAGAQLYSHHTVRRSTSLGRDSIERAPTRIGNGVYIGPGAVIQMGSTIGDGCVIGALSLVAGEVPAGSKCFGVPGRVRSGAVRDAQLDPSCE